jgi:hypothetical protein
MSQYLTSCQIMQNASKKSKHTSLLNGGVTCNMTLNDGLLFWSDHLANLYKFKLPSWVVDQSVCNDWWSHGGNTNFHFCLSPKSPSPTSFSINSNYHALTTCNRQHASGIKNWQYMWMPRQCIFRFDHSTMLHGTYKLSWRLLGLWLSIGFQFVFTGTKLVSSTSGIQSSEKYFREKPWSYLCKMCFFEFFCLLCCIPPAKARD